MDNKVKKGAASPRIIGDVTSITIPKQFKDVLTGKTMPVTEDILSEINLAIQKRELVHLIMTGINKTHQLKMNNEFIKRSHKETFYYDSSQMIH
ncbi:hypothetical protein ACIFOE_25860 [Paenibacillus sp. NRS-1783]|uniref:hypothetical protein n=1 Tax=Paenibacillus sp. NRS-1783 TaxID=3233907 RepID=UPI003D27DD36